MAENMQPQLPVRSGVLWFPEWPVAAWALAAGGSVEGPVAVVENNRVVSCSARARAEGVRRGQRRREAQGCSPSLRVVPADIDRDHRMFAPLIDLLEQVTPGIQVIRPGLVALRMRGPARYYGGEEEAMGRLREPMIDSGMANVRGGVADGLFTAEQAAYEASPIRIVPQGEGSAFLAPLPVNRLGEAELATLLPRLGVRRLGEFAALDEAQVRDRFGPNGVRLHALAGGRDPRGVQPRTPPPELARQVEFSPALELVEQVAFAVRTTADEFVGGLAEKQLVCTELRVELTAEEGERSERVWLHPSAFDSSAVVDRVRWQLQAAAGNQIDSGVVRVRLEPVAVDAAAHHSPGLFGSGPDERVRHALSRVQAMLGGDAVLTAAIGGGRSLAERQVLTAWGERVVLPLSPHQPWPGHVPTPLPSTVFPEPRALSVVAADGSGVCVDVRGAVSAAPAMLIDGARRHPVAAWAGPWPLDERTWDPERQRKAHRFQVVDDTQTAWLLLCDSDGQWRAEARYD
ncbi:DNA polymerase Y family protein [Tessaracoccus caeni]|uniref:DNA polymerase Y family protein n=1 Tax=Tessaracoccus caeni TaxID=3031239 RepID=UPI0023DBE6EC|nr:DNA polymerase Y family protein [Tessaracoccus caeni]MDF1489708.1 DNA polymerase Y family protein [Tessaracoccus caeni]